MLAVLFAILGVLLIYQGMVALFGAGTDNLLTAALQFLTLVIVTLHGRHVRRDLEPKVDQIAAVTKRQLGERDPENTPAPGDVIGWDGSERRGIKP